MKDLVRMFLEWWKDAPAWKAVWFIPLVVVLYIAALMKNKIQGD